MGGLAGLPLMKPLLSKTIRPFIFYVLIVLAISVPVYYVVVDNIWKAELDEHNHIIAGKTAFSLNQLNLSDRELQQSIALWNKIQPGTNLQQVKPSDNLRDRTYTVDKPGIPGKKQGLDRFRCLSTVIEVGGKHYRFLVETNIEETRETIAVLTAVTIFFFLLMVAGLLMLTRKLSNTVWKPFHVTLDKLKHFNLDSQSKIEFEKTDTKEFEELNQSLDKLIEHTIATYKIQKEFTENAAHELQTPLAILKNKLDVLLQSDDLTERQYNLAEEMNRALVRSSRINKNLLLLAKIENGQFDSFTDIRFDVLLQQSLDLLSEYAVQKSISSNLAAAISVSGNSSLIEVLVNNLLLNAIRYTLPGGFIAVKLSKEKLEIINSGVAELKPDLLFKRFSGLSIAGEGSGLGLSIVQEICKVHQWSVHYRFDDDQHIFTVNL